ncbi:COPS4 isoform 8 [Pongo abelii]|uniref:COPS4 isoform 8 n=1 Tax=Pongo abelii TaxID=9601 RepID=A0A8I5SZW9_PONAB|nr:COPS4 isoform 8 [Pongo abelii]
MAAAVRQDLAQLMNSSGSHKDLAGKTLFSFVIVVGIVRSWKKPFSYLEQNN